MFDYGYDEYMHMHTVMCEHVCICFHLCLRSCGMHVDNYDIRERLLEAEANLRKRDEYVQYVVCLV